MIYVARLLADPGIVRNRLKIRAKKFGEGIRVNATFGNSGIVSRACPG